MSVKTYSLKRQGDNKLSEHFKIREFRCRDDSDKVLIETDLVKYLEKIREHFGCSSINIVSGYRTPTHDKNVGGSGRGAHTKGKAVDFIAYDKRKNPISSKEIALYLEDLGVKGIGYRCGGSSTSTHMDINYRSVKWYGDEKKSMSASVGSFYSYLGVKHTKRMTTAAVNARQEPSLSGKKYKTLAKETPVKVANTAKIENDGYTWVRVKIGSGHYWVAEKYLK